jgi:hypothetical protein
VTLVLLLLMWPLAPTLTPTSQPASAPASQPTSRPKSSDEELIDDLDFIEFLQMSDEAPWFVE